MKVEELIAKIKEEFFRGMREKGDNEEHIGAEWVKFGGLFVANLVDYVLVNMPEDGKRTIMMGLTENTPDMAQKTLAALANYLNGNPGAIDWRIAVEEGTKAAVDKYLRGDYSTPQVG